MVILLQGLRLIPEQLKEKANGKNFHLIIARIGLLVGLGFRSELLNGGGNFGRGCIIHPGNFGESKFKYENGLFKKSNKPTDQGEI
jgi:hypothetical protein